MMTNSLIYKDNQPVYFSSTALLSDEMVRVEETDMYVHKCSQETADLYVYLILSSMDNLSERQRLIFHTLYSSYICTESEYSFMLMLAPLEDWGDYLLK